VVKGEKNFYGQFMHMECLTYVPFDRDGIDTSLLTKDELKWINDYHKEVFDRISPYMGVDEYKWLKEVCHPIII
jgi:Xaa-Pro aminopeptidase